MWEDTIVARASAEGTGAVGMLRLSGDDAVGIATRIITPRSTPIPECQSRRVYLGCVYASDGALIDEITFIVYRKPHSYTGENTVEIFLHGNTILIDLIVTRCIGEGARLALPGEFTRRAFMNGKIDLTQAESVADLIAAQAEEEIKIAAKMLSGEFGKRLKRLREDMLEIISLAEASIDFPEEDDVTASQTRTICARISGIREEISAMLASYDEGKRIRNGIRVTIAGQTNAGKSSLMNALFEEEKSIVTPVHGTTRDVIEGVLILNGVRVIFHDTAGLRTARGIVEKEGVRRTQKSIDEADIVIYVIDAYRTDFAGDLKRIAAMLHNHLIVVLNKTDLAGGTAPVIPESIPVCRISALHKTGLDTLHSALCREITSLVRHTHSAAFTVNRRHAECLKQGGIALKEAQQAIDNGLTEDFFVENIKEAQRALAQIVGDISPDDVLDRIFSQFCIGK
ncbi:MAG: tRNA uridine-5-carboxymethylaminomethyl(34) synthesis GTPase MnmE [Candidatus Auribacterota bacterium]|nr:tRNA uridine-5-carboxymethylaminomethyl(34) synthesis GTPase MnmE [Candidatus Auribacterota bacterium]